jgi:hypothetical protein
VAWSIGIAIGDAVGLDKFCGRKDYMSIRCRRVSMAASQLRAVVRNSALLLLAAQRAFRTRGAGASRVRKSLHIKELWMSTRSRVLFLRDIIRLIKAASAHGGDEAKYGDKPANQQPGDMRAVDCRMWTD